MSKNSINTVYHYCRLETFLSILKNKTIRLSDINKSNDFSETKSTIELIKNAAVELCHKNSIEQYQPIMLGIDNESVMKHFFETVLHRFRKFSDVLVYAACFSELEDSLSQWCEYADNGKGVAIGFNLKCLKQICESYGKGFLNVEKIRYLNKKDSSIDHMISKYASEFYGEIIDAIINGNLDKLFENPFGTDFQAIESQRQLIRDSVFIKHESFSAEQEWRIVLRDEYLQKNYDDWENYYNWDKEHAPDGIGSVIPEGLQFRSIGDDITSYMDLSFEGYIDEVIDCIIIGPSCKVQVDDIYQIIHHFGFWNFDDEHIYLSKAPYNSRNK